MQFQEVQRNALRPRRRRAIPIEASCNQSVGELLAQARTRFDKLIETHRKQDELERELGLHDGWQPIRPRAHGGTR